MITNKKNRAVAKATVAVGGLAFLTCGVSKEAREYFQLGIERIGVAVRGPRGWVVTETMELVSTEPGHWSNQKCIFKPAIAKDDVNPAFRLKTQLVPTDYAEMLESKGKLEIGQKYEVTFDQNSNVINLSPKR